MFERFTEGSIKVIMLAQAESRRLGHNYVGTEQILLGLIGQGKGVAARALGASGVSLKLARIEVEKIIGRGHDFIGVEIPFTENAKRLLRLSLGEAQRLNQAQCIGTEHLLLGLIKETQGVGYRVLKELKIDLVKLHAQTITACGGSSNDLLNTVPAQPLFPTVLSDTTNFGLEPFMWYESDAIVVVQRAWGIAETFGSKEISVEHLFLAVLRDSNPTHKALKSGGLDVAKVRQAIVKMIELGDAAPAKSLPFSAATQKVLECAWIEGTELRQSLITKECIMLGLLRQENGIVPEVLKNLGADLQMIRLSLIESIKTAPQVPVIETVPTQSGLLPKMKYSPWLTSAGKLNYVKVIAAAFCLFAVIEWCVISAVGVADESNRATVCLWVAVVAGLVGVASTHRPNR